MGVSSSSPSINTDYAAAPSPPPPSTYPHHPQYSPYPLPPPSTLAPASPPQYGLAWMSPTEYGVPVLHDQSRGRDRWTTGLCSCLGDIPSCLLGCFCPCLVFGMNAEYLDHGMTSPVAAALVWYLLQQVALCGWLYSCWYRQKLRARFGLPPRPLHDCLVHCCCWPCAICQEYREIQHRGFCPDAVVYVTPPEEQTFAERTWHA